MSDNQTRAFQFNSVAFGIPAAYGCVATPTNY